MAESDELVLKLACAQFGVITRTQARTAGLSQHQIRYRLQIGHWLPLGPGAYLVEELTDSANGWSARLIAACLTLDGVASHHSAAALWGLIPPTIHVEVTVTRARYRRRPGVNVHSTTQSAQLAPRTVEAIPTTCVERTLIDLATVRDVQELGSLIRRSLDLRLTTQERLVSAELSHRKRGRPGIPRFRKVLATIETQAAGAVHCSERVRDGGRL
jgi:predicted transcriptional regulator of viral defense system